jgi:hypothetical protein
MVVGGIEALGVCRRRRLGMQIVARRIFGSWKLQREAERAYSQPMGGRGPHPRTKYVSLLQIERHQYRAKEVSEDVPQKDIDRLALQQNHWTQPTSVRLRPDGIGQKRSIAVRLHCTGETFFS